MTTTSQPSPFSQTQKPYRRYIATLALTVATTMSLTAMAAPPKASKPITQQFVNFGEQIIDGQIKRPQASYASARRGAVFSRMLKWKKRSFLNQLPADAKSIR